MGLYQFPLALIVYKQYTYAYDKKYYAPEYLASNLAGRFC